MRLAVRVGGRVGVVGHDRRGARRPRRAGRSAPRASSPRLRRTARRRGRCAVPWALVSRLWTRCDRSTAGRPRRWPSPSCVAARRLRRSAPREQVFRWASVTKPVTALATLVAAEEGIIDLDEPAGPPGSTVRHLLAHAAGLPFEGRTPISPPGQAAELLEHRLRHACRVVGEAAEMPFAEYLRPRCSGRWRCRRSCAARRPPSCTAASTTCVRFAAELQRPRLIAPETLAEATSVQFPGLVGVLPDIGRMDPNDWGLGVRAARREAAALDRLAELAAHLRALRQQRDVPLGRSRGRHRRSPA